MLLRALLRELLRVVPGWCGVGGGVVPGVALEVVLGW